MARNADDIFEDIDPFSNRISISPPISPANAGSLSSFYKPSNFWDNLSNEWQLSSQQDFIRLFQKPSYEVDPDWVRNKRYLEPEFLEGYEHKVQEFVRSTSREEGEYIKRVIDRKERARRELRDTGSWIPALLVGVAHPINLIPIPWLRGAGWIGGFVKGSTTVGGLVATEELARPQFAIDVPIEESVVAVGSSFLIGGIFSSVIGGLTKRSVVNTLGDNLDNVQSNYDRQSSLSSWAEKISDNRINEPIKYFPDIEKFRFNSSIIEEEKLSRAWIDNPKYSMGEKQKFADDEFSAGDDWMLFHFHRANGFKNNSKRSGESDLEYTHRINRLSHIDYNLHKFNGAMDRPMISRDETIPDNIYTAKGSDIIPLNPVNRLLKRARVSFGGDSFIAQFGHVIADTGLMLDGAGKGFGKISSVANMAARNWGWRGGELIRGLDNEYQASIGYGRKDSDFTGVRISAKTPLVKKDKEETFRKWFIDYIKQSADKKGDRKKIDDEFSNNSVNIIKEHFEAVRIDAEKLGMWGTNKEEFKNLGERLSQRIEYREKNLDDIKETYLNKMDKLVMKMLDLEARSRDGFMRGMTHKQYDTYLKIADEIEEMQRGAKFTSHDEHLNKLIQDITDLRKMRLFVKQNEDGVWNSRKSVPDDINYFPRFFNNDAIERHRSVFINTIKQYFKDEPTARVWDDEKGFITIGTPVKPPAIKYIDIPSSKAMAYFNRADNTIVMDRKRIQESFDKKSWTTPRIDGVKPLPKNKFKKVEDWEEFIYFHELSHWKYPRLSTETLGQYENRINMLALDNDNKRLLKQIIDDDKGYVVSDKDAEKYAVEFTDRQINETKYGVFDGGINPVGLGRGLRHFHQRQMDIPNSRLVDVATPDGPIDFIILDQSIVRRYMDKTGPQIEMARMTGDRLGEGKIFEVKQHIDEKFIQPLRDKIKQIEDTSPTTKSDKKEISLLQKKIDDLEDDKAKTIQDIIDIRDGVLLQFANFDPTRLSTRVVNLLKNWASYTQMGSVITSVSPDHARPLMVHGFREYFQHIPSFALNPALISRMSKETRNEVGEALEYSGMTTAKQYMEFGDGTFAQKTTAIERASHAGQGPWYVGNLLAPWTHGHKVFTNYLASSLLVRYSKQVANNSLTKRGRIVLDMTGITNAEAKRIANEMTVELSSTGSSYLLNLGAWNDKALAAKVGAALNREIQRTMVVPVTAGKPNIMSGVFPKTIGSVKIEKEMKAFAESMLGRNIGFSVTGDRVSNPIATLPFVFMTYPIAATSSVLSAGLKQGISHRDLSVFAGFTAMTMLGWLSGWMKHYNWLDLSFEEQAIRAFELAGMAGIFSDASIIAEELTAGHLSLREALGYPTLFKRDTDDVVGRIGGAPTGMIWELMNAVLDPNMKANKRASAIRRAIPFQNMIWWRHHTYSTLQRQGLEPFIKMTYGD